MTTSTSTSQRGLRKQTVGRILGEVRSTSKVYDTVWEQKWLKEKFLRLLLKT